MARSRACVVKQLSFRIDGVFLPLVPDVPIYFAEVQFQPDPDLYSRFFSEIFLYLDKTDFSNDWRGVILFPNRRTDNSNPERYSEILNTEISGDVSTCQTIALHSSISQVCDFLI